MSQARVGSIFIGFAIGNLILLVAVATLGLIKPSAGVHYHVLLAVFSLLLSCLIHVGLFTYLSVTGKVVAHALHFGGLELGPLDSIRENKRVMARLVLFVVLSAVFAIATGAAHHRGDGVSVLHLAAVSLVLITHGAVFFREYAVVLEVSALMDRTLEAYTELKKQRDGGRQEH